MHDLTAIKDRAIARGFPELDGARVDVEYEPMADALFAYSKRDPTTYCISIDTEMFGAPSLAVEGGIAQQLAHIVHDAKRGPICGAIDSFLYGRVGIYTTVTDRAADLLTARRGFTDQLLALHKFHDANHTPYDQSDGLTVDELTALLERKYFD